MRFRKLPSGLVINLDHVVTMVPEPNLVAVFFDTRSSDRPSSSHLVFRDEVDGADAAALRAFIEREVQPIDPCANVVAR